MDRSTELVEAKSRAEQLRVNGQSDRIKQYGFDSPLEFILFHWDKLTPQEQEELRKVGVRAPER